jgi:putative sporulation protein YtxC
MELFKIIVMNGSDRVICSLHQEMVEKLRHMQNFPATIKLHIERYEFHSEMYGECENELSRTIEHEMLECLSQVIAEHILDVQEKHLLRNIIKNQLQFHHLQDIDRIYELAARFLRKMDAGMEEQFPAHSNRRRDIVKRTQDYFQEYKTLILEGYIFFRLKDYVEELSEIVGYAMEEFKMDQQYQEFISLLKYFVCIQEVKIPLIHVIHKAEHEFELLDHHFQLLSSSGIDSSFKLDMIDHHLNFEDMVVSTLISVSPAHICVHTRDSDVTIIQTILQIFEDRVKLCTYCHICSSYVRENNKKDHLYP